MKRLHKDVRNPWKRGLVGDSPNPDAKFNQFMRGYAKYDHFDVTQKGLSWNSFGRYCRHILKLDEMQAVREFHKEWKKVASKLSEYELYHPGEDYNLLAPALEKKYVDALPER